MKQTLQLRLSQHLALTPQLQQSIRLLQLSTLELNQEIEKFLQDNPLLEREDLDAESRNFGSGDDALTRSGEEAQPSQPDVDPAPAEAPASQTDWLSEGAARAPRSDDDEADYADIQAAATTLREHLNAQLGTMPLSERDRALVGLLIEALNDDGYLTLNLEELADLLPPEAEIDPEELRIALNHLQHLDPLGVGARNPPECLALQLKGKPESPTQALALSIVERHLDLLAARDFVRLKKLLQCSDDALRDAHALIMTLNPRPAAEYAPLDARYVVPDVVVKKLRGAWVCSLNADAMPKLRINRLYADILHGQRGNAAAGGLAGQLQEAKWLIKNVQQRFDTILRVSQAIVERQRQFFDYGEVAMRPLTLREIAEQLGLHESTISRVTTQKFMATPRGIFELKYFFGSHVATETGGACSATAIRALIRQLVGAEDGRRPLSDSKIAEILSQQGIMVARRTIAKYREGLNIPPVNLRKSI